MTLLLRCLDELVNDEGFHIPSERAAEALEAAKTFRSWSRVNQQQLATFATALYGKLRKALDVSAKTTQRRAEKMWGTFHAIRCSEEFLELWRNVLGAASCKVTPIMYQHLTSTMFKYMIKEELPPAYWPIC